MKTPCLNQDGRNQAVQDAMELSQRRSPPRGAGANKGATSKHTGGGGEDWQRYPSPPVMQTTQGGRADQTRRGNGKHPNKTNKPNRVMERTPIKIHTVRWKPPKNQVG